MSATLRKYADYSVRVADDLTAPMYYEQYGTHILKCHYRIARVPSRKEFVVRHYRDATPADRADVDLDRIPRSFEHYERQGWAFKHRAPAGYYFWIARCGYLIDDPLVNLELEMMIDLSSGVTL